MAFSLRQGSGPPMVLNVRPGTPPSHVASTDSSNRAEMSAAAALTGTWLPLESDPLKLFTPSPLLTNEGREASAILVAASEGGAAVASCVPYPPPLNMAWQEAKGFESRGGDIVIRVAVDGDVERVVQMNGAPAERDRERNQGVSVGRWEGDTLVVETTFEELSDEEEVMIGVIPSKGTRLVERFELSEDRSRLAYTYSIENAVYLTQPFAGSAVWAFREDLEVPRLACDNDIAGRFLEEAKAIEGNENGGL
jgi:hypothetical protein